MVPASKALHEGGWFARRSVQRVAAAHIAAHRKTKRALRRLEAGCASKSEAVRTPAWTR